MKDRRVYDADVTDLRLLQFTITTPMISYYYENTRTLCPPDSLVHQSKTRSAEFGEALK